MNISLDLKGIKTEPTDADRSLGELMLYIASRCSDHPKFGATKLNKILFFADFIAFRREGKPITGTSYMKLEHGPAPRRLVPVQERLVDEKAAVIQERVLFSGNKQKRLIPLRAPDLTLFTAPQIELVHQIIESFQHATAEEVSDISHCRMWEAADLNEDIPYEASFISDEKATHVDIARGEALAHEGGWDG
jgi:hypothetical protein